MILRPYQREAVDATIEGLKTRPGNPLVALPTGTGKSLVIGEVIRELVTNYPVMRIAMLTHNKELVKQNFEKLQTLYPEADIGIYSAGLGLKQSGSRIVFATVQSVASVLKRKGNPFGPRHLVVVDEAHLISSGDNTNYQKVFDAWRPNYPSMKIMGLTATPFRTKKGLLYGPEEDQMFDYLSADLCNLNAFNQLVEDKYLAPLIPMRTTTEVDLTGVRMQAGDYNQRQAADAVGQKGILENAVDEMVKQGSDRKSWLVFCSGIENTEKVNQLLRDRGIISACVHSKQLDDINDEIIRDFKAGRIRAVVNANILTVGFDAPGVDLIGLLRPTQSVGLHVQICGRGTRPCEGKENCLVLDFAGNTMRLGPINDPCVPGRTESGNGDAPFKICKDTDDGDGCGMINHISAKVCGFCGKKFEIREKLTRKASDIELIADGREVIKKLAINSVGYRKYIPMSKIPCILLEYRCEGGKTYRSYLPWENPNAKWRVEKWWKARFPDPDKHRPDTADDLIDWIDRGFKIPTPLGITVDINNRFNGRIMPEVKKEIWNNAA